MSSGRGRSPCDTGPRELRLDVICPGTLAAASRRNDGYSCVAAASGRSRTCAHNAQACRRWGCPTSPAPRLMLAGPPKLGEDCDGHVGFDDVGASASLDLASSRSMRRSSRWRVPGPLQRPHPGRVPPRSPRVLPVGSRRRPRGAGGDPAAHRAVPRHVDGGPRPGRVDDRPAPVDGVRLLPLRPHRRAHRLEPRPVRPPTAGAPDRRARAGPLASSARSCSPPSASTRRTPRSPCCSA